MADEKKPDDSILPEILIIVFLGLFILGSVFTGLPRETVRGFTQETSSFFSTIRNLATVALQWISFISVVGIVYSLFQLARLQKKRLRQIITITPPSVNHSEERWLRLLAFARSHNSAERKIAVIEADALLDDIVTKMGYSGDTLGEKLQNIDKSDFETLDLAWDAHRVRNRIAHKNEEVSVDEARRIMQLYERVFSELHYF